MGDEYFSVVCKDGKRVLTTKEYWDLIVSWKHPIMKGREGDVKAALMDPDEIRQSKSDKRVRLYYRKARGGFVCVVVKLKNGEGFITYLTTIVKEGDVVWTRR